MLDSAELEGVMAHELTHVINRDVMVMTLAGFFASLASLILQFAFFFGGGYGRSDEEEQDIMVVDPRLRARLRDLLPAAARAVALPRVRRRPRLGGADRAAQRAGLGADQDLAARSSRQPSQDLRQAEGLSAFFIIPAEGEEVAAEHLRRPPAARAAPGRAASGWRPSCQGTAADPN